MERTRVILVVTIELDPVPGAFHTQENARMHIEAMLKEMIPHYNPTVLSAM